jgi:hypothetical protein
MEFLNSFPEGRNMVAYHKGVEMSKENPNNNIYIPTDFPYNIVDYMQNILPQNTKFVSRFIGFKSQICYVDYAIYINENLSAFLIFDDEKSYNTYGDLTRVQQYRDYLYAQAFPGVLLYRMKRSEIHSVGEKAAAQLLSNAILEDQHQ